MAKHFREALAIGIVGFLMAFSVIGVGPAFGIWPFSSGEDSTSNEKNSALLDVNTASQDALAALPDVGDARAKAIVAYRRQHGPFNTVEDVKQVPGIEDEVFASIKDHLTVGEEQSSRNESSTQSQAKAIEADQ
jgi:competence protein ComEA